MRALLPWLIVACVVISLIGACSPRDSTDPPNGRSGMGLRIDHATGCHYLTTLHLLGESAITPRIRADGRPYCTPSAEN